MPPHGRIEESAHPGRGHQPVARQCGQLAAVACHGRAARAGLGARCAVHRQPGGDGRRHQPGAAGAGRLAAQHQAAGDAAAGGGGRRRALHGQLPHRHRPDDDGQRAAHRRARGRRPDRLAPAAQRGAGRGTAGLVVVAHAAAAPARRLAGPVQQRRSDAGAEPGRRAAGAECRADVLDHAQPQVAALHDQPGELVLRAGPAGRPEGRAACRPATSRRRRCAVAEAPCRRTAAAADAGGGRDGPRRSPRTQRLLRATPTPRSRRWTS